jgi:hypothetical protein
MKLAELEQRMTRLEQQVSALAEKVSATPSKGVNAWIDEIRGTIPRNAVSLRAQRLGEKWRRSQRPARPTRKTPSK